MEEYESLYQNGQEGACFQKLVRFFLQNKDSIPLQAYNLMLKLCNENSQMYLNIIKKARAAFQQLYNFDEIMRAFRRGEKINKSLFKMDEVRIFIEVSIKLARSMLESGKIDESKATIEELLNMVKLFDNAPLKWFLERINEMIANYQKLGLEPIDPPQRQLQVYQTLLDDQEELNILKQEGLFGYLIPMHWFRKWESYVQYPNQVEELQDLNKMKEESLFSQVSQQDIDTLYTILGIETSAIDEELDANFTHPGPIDGSQLVDIQWDLMIDTFPPKQYQNYQLKPNLVEGRDFMIVGHKIWKYFKEQYSAFEVKRIIIQGQDLKPVVDLQARLIRFIAFPEQQLYSVVLGNKENFDALNKKIMRLFNKKLNIPLGGLFPQTKWLKFLNFDEQDSFFSNLKQNGVQTTYKVKASELDLRTPLDEIDIIDSDILLLDININNRWSISLEVAQKFSLDLNQKTPSAIASMINYFNISGPARLTNESRLGLTGLQNLGNTCFMNSALQCLSNMYELTEYLVSNKFVSDLNPKNPIGTSNQNKFNFNIEGQLALNYADLMKILWFGRQSSVSPFEIKRVVAKNAPQFVGYGQQDSQELLSYVLDGLHEDLNRILQKPTVEEAVITTQSDQEAANIFWQNYKRRNDSIIIDLVAGQFKSTLICPDCKIVSRNFDPFLTMSLPIPNFVQVQFSLYFIQSDTNQIPLKFLMVLSSETTTQEILEKISKKVDVPSHQLDPVMIKEHKIKDHLNSTHTAKWIADHEGILFVQQLQKESYKLQQNETHILLYYVKPEIQSYVRQLVFKRQGTVGELFIRIYFQTRPHIVNFIASSTEKVFPQSRVQEFTQRPILTEENWDILIYEIQQLQQLQKFPFILKLSDQIGKLKPQEFNQNDTNLLDQLPQYLKVELLIADFVETSSLKLQRCKQVLLDDQQTEKLKNNYNLDDCIRSFTKQEILGKGDEWYCGNCKKHVQASKKMEVYKAPQILILHLKRFKTNRISNFGKYYFSGGSQKINEKINFPVQNLDLNKIVLSKGDNDPINYTYDLFAVSNHMGGLNTGHYTAYALSPIRGQWIEYNDSQVRAASVSDVVSDAAYLLFYRRKDAQPCKMLNFK